jgi:phosphoglycerol transferase MdoB-like AlkP superfamily enzyme
VCRRFEAFIAGHGRLVMPRSPAFLFNRWAAPDAVTRRRLLWIASLVTPHICALALMASTENSIVGAAVFLLTWGLVNFLWLVLLRRPLVSAALALVTVVTLVLLSRLKYEIIWMTASFLDVWIVNAETISFLLSVRPDLPYKIACAGGLILAVVVVLWRIDTRQVRRRSAAAGLAACLAGLSGMSLAFPQDGSTAWFGDSYVSKFSRSGASAISGLLTEGYLESAATVAERLRTLPDATCTAPRAPPHIILVHDESSFDIRVAPGVKVPPGYGEHFRSFDGKARHFLTEGAGGPSWYTEYNVLAGLSARSFGRFAFYVTQIAAGRVERGLPAALRRCGYQTFSIYPALGAFMSARSFQTSTGVQKFVDQDALGTNRIEPDRFYYDRAVHMIGREHHKGPMFLFIYLAQNHWPWDYRWRPELMPEWKDPGNSPAVDEYLRRQTMSFHDYAALLDRLKREFPHDSFLLVRYGDHQPDFASLLLDPALDENGINRRLMTYDPRYYTTYYAIDAIRFKPVDLASALDAIEAPYLPVIVQEAAGVPLDPSFVEQKKILQRCNGLFYGCAGGAEARRFNRLLIEAGLIKGL